MDPDPHQSDEQDPDPDQSDKQDPYPHQSDAELQHCCKGANVLCRLSYVYDVLVGTLRMSGSRWRVSDGQR
jgi:hypothetical protein